jgi:hypothetical protein
MKILAGEGSEKTKPIQSQTKPIAGLRPESRSTKPEIRKPDESKIRLFFSVNSK